MAPFPPATQARLAGLLYLIIICCGVFGEVAIRASLITPDDATATAGAISAASGRFRLGFAADAVMALADAGLAVLLFVLLRPVGPVLALSAMVFRLIQTAILGANLLNYYAALLVLQGGGPADQTAALAQLFLRLHSHGYDLGLIFFGVNCLLTGLLIWRSAVIPRAVGVLIAAAGLVYLTGSGLRFLLPGLHAGFTPAYLVPLVAETAFALWLLIRGHRLADAMR